MATPCSHDLTETALPNWMDGMMKDSITLIFSLQL